MKTIRVLMMTCGLVVAPFMAQAGTAVSTQGSISFVSGGAGDEERQALEAMSSRFNVKLTHALQNGEFVADVLVRIIDAQGKVVLDTVTDGPFLYAQIPAGTYTVQCSLKGKEQKQTVRVDAAKQAQLKFTWASA